MLTVLENNRGFNLLFTDVVLPQGTSGPKLVRRARALKPCLAVLMTSGYADEVLVTWVTPAIVLLLRIPYRLHQLSTGPDEVLEHGAFLRDNRIALHHKTHCCVADSRVGEHT